MIRGMLLLVGLVVLVLTGLDFPKWMDDGRLVSWYSPVVGKLMELSLFLWLAGLVLWIALARTWWRTFSARRRAASGVRSAQGRRSPGSRPGGADTRYLRENRLWREASDETWRNLFGGALLGLFVGFGAGMVFGWAVGLLTGVGALVIAATMSGTGDIVAAGAEGEDLAVGIVKRLPAGYTPFNQVKVPRTDRQPIELDLIVVGPNSVHVIEVKHNKGEIQIRPDAPEWTVFKTGRRGGSYEATMRNPIKQVRGQVDALARYLKSQGIKRWVTGVVVLSHPDAEFEPAVVQDVAILRLGQLAAHVQSAGVKRGTSESAAAVRAIARLIEHEDGDLPPPPPRRSPECGGRAEPSHGTRAAPSVELVVPPRDPPQHRDNASTETRFWPLGYLLMLIGTPWVLPGLVMVFNPQMIEKVSALTTALFASGLTALHTWAIYRLNRCREWCWTAAGLACLHVAMACVIDPNSAIDHHRLLQFMTVLYPAACAVMQFLRYESVYGVPLVPHHRVTYAETSPAEYEMDFERAHWLELPDDPPLMEWEMVRKKVRDAEYEVVDERWGRKGDRYSPLPVRAGPALAKTTAWSLIGTMVVGSALMLITVVARLHYEICLGLNRYCDIRWDWVAWHPSLPLLGSGFLLVAVSVLRRGARCP
nr:D342 [uncultured bacterium]